MLPTPVNASKPIAAPAPARRPAAPAATAAVAAARTAGDSLSLSAGADPIRAAARQRVAALVERAKSAQTPAELNAIAAELQKITREMQDIPRPGVPTPPPALAGAIRGLQRRIDELVGEVKALVADIPNKRGQALLMQQLLIEDRLRTLNTLKLDVMGPARRLAEKPDADPAAVGRMAEIAREASSATTAQALTKLVLEARQLGPLN